MSDLPAPDGTKPLKTSALRERMFRAALTTALEEGFCNVTMDRIAQRAGVSKGGLLYHFRSKQALITALLHHYGYGGESDKTNDETEARDGSAIDWLTVAILLAAAENPALLMSPDNEDTRLNKQARTSEAAAVWGVLRSRLAERLSTLQDRRRRDEDA